MLQPIVEEDREGLQKRADPFLRASHRPHHVHSKELLHPLMVETDFLPICLVGHVQDQHHGNAQFRQLGGQVEGALRNGGVDHVQDQIQLGLGGGQFLEDHPLLRGMGGKGIDPGKVHHLHLLPVQEETPRFVLHRHAGIVSHMLTGTRQSVENAGLATIGIPRQGNAISLHASPPS